MGDGEFLVSSRMPYEYHPSKTAMDGAAFRGRRSHGPALLWAQPPPLMTRTCPRQHKVTAAVARVSKLDSTFVPVEVRGGERILGKIESQPAADGRRSQSFVTPPSRRKIERLWGPHGKDLVCAGAEKRSNRWPVGNHLNRPGQAPHRLCPRKHEDQRRLLPLLLWQRDQDPARNSGLPAKSKWWPGPTARHPGLDSPRCTQ